MRCIIFNQKPNNQSRRGALLYLRIFLFGDVSLEALGGMLNDCLFISITSFKSVLINVNVGPSKPKRVLFGRTRTVVGREEVTLLRTLLPLRWKDTVWEHGTLVNS